MHLLKLQEVVVRNYRPHAKERGEKKATGKFHLLCRARLLHKKMLGNFHLICLFGSICSIIGYPGKFSNSWISTMYKTYI